MKLPRGKGHMISDKPAHDQLEHLRPARLLLLLEDAVLFWGPKCLRRDPNLENYLYIGMT